MNTTDDRDNDPETPTTRASVGSPRFVPPVIFAGLASPSESGRSQSHKRFNEVIKACENRRRLPRSESHDSLVERDVRRYSSHVRSTTPSAYVYRSSIAESETLTGEFSEQSYLHSPSKSVSRSVCLNSTRGEQGSKGSQTPCLSASRLGTPRIPGSIRTEECRSSLLEQITDLQSALSHSKAREESLLKKKEDLTSQLNEKQVKLKEIQESSQNLEQENRRLKANIRELMGASMSSTVISPSMTTDSGIIEEPRNTMADSERKSVSESGRTEKKDKKKKGWLALLSGRNTYQDNPTLDEEMVFDESQLGEDLKNAEHVIKTLQVTKVYVQKVLRRNSELESRCKQLEDGNDIHIRSLHEELSSLRKDRSSLEASLTRTKHIVEEQKEEVGLLHRELREMHERQRLHRVLVHELQDVKEENEFLRDALAAEKTEVQKIMLEWEQEKAFLQADLTFERNKNANMNIVRDQQNEASTSCAMALRVAELEGMLAKIRQEYSEKTASHEKERSELRKNLRKTTQQLEIAKRREYEIQNSKNTLEAELKIMRDQLNASQRSIVTLREQQAALMEQLSEVDDVKASLTSCQERIETQANQIHRYLQTIREANERYAELLESKTVSDCLLHTQQKEKEKTIEENIKTHEQLYGQSSVYRQRLEDAVKEISSLKKQLVEKEEALHHSAESTEISHLKEIRHLKESLNNVKRQSALECERKLSELRDIYEKEFMALRQQKEEKIERLVAEYEKYIKEVKLMQDKKLRFIQEAKDNEVRRCIETMSKRIADCQAAMKERITRQRILHEEELHTIQLSHGNNLKTQLEHKVKEIDELKSSLSILEKEYENKLIIAEQKGLEATELLQQFKARKVEAEEERDTLLVALMNERDALKAELDGLVAQHAEERKRSEESQNETLETLQRQNEFLQNRCNETQEELKAFQNKIADIQQDNICLRKTIEDCENLIGKSAADFKNDELVCVERRLKETECRPEGAQSSDEGLDLIGTLREKVELLEVTKQQLEERLEVETKMYQEKLKSQEERLQSLVPLQLHVTQILSRNTELENLLATESQRLTETISEKTSEIATLETKLARLQHLIKERDTEIDTLRTRVSSLDDKCKTLQNAFVKEQEARETIFLQQQRIDELSVKVEDLTAAKKNSELKQSKANESESPVIKPENSQISRECIRTIKQLGEELSRSQQENSRLSEEIKKLQDASKDFSRLTLEYTLQARRIQMQEETIAMLHERIQNKQSLIDELSAQLRSETNADTQWKVSEYDATKIQQLEEKLQKLTKQCQQLSDEKLSYDHERSSLHHRLELEQQLLSQCMEQKERQMQHLIDTNKRAETLLLRNTELEALLFNLQVEKESHRCCATGTNGLLTSGSNGECETESAKLDEFKKIVEAKEKRIQQLLEELRFAKNVYAKEIETLTTRLHFATLEQSLVPLSSEDDLLRLLVEKTTELQGEVKRLHTERDENSRSIMSANTRQQFVGSGSDEDVVHLQSRIERLVEEREQLRKQVTQLGLSHETEMESTTDTVSCFHDSNRQGLSVKCRLELLVKRCQCLYNVLNSQPKFEVFSGKEICLLLLDLEKLFKDMENALEVHGITEKSQCHENCSLLTYHLGSGSEKIGASMEVVDSAVQARTLYPSLFNASPQHVEKEKWRQSIRNEDELLTDFMGSSDEDKNHEGIARGFKRVRASAGCTPAKQQKCASKIQD